MTADLESEELQTQAEETAKQSLKEKYDIEVEITKSRVLPEHIANEVRLEGHVQGDDKQFFNITVNYETNETSNFSMSPELVEHLREKGYEPFDSKK
ncbi:hypothetical protein HII30_07220 [Paenibacillus lemnae]|uniref:Uncharacterized protein n=1 Tax=Paenibacillus lemnae TaxID=1330551 RepID=A0A848M7P0_PAELE|nr:hypothetical protein [Paenibacillus lemnae]